MRIILKCEMVDFVHVGDEGDVYILGVGIINIFYVFYGIGK